VDVLPMGVDGPHDADSGDHGESPASIPDRSAQR
jgi:hypothetical protein